MGVRYQRAVDLVELTGILQTTVTGLSIDEIADRFEVSRRTAERMLSALRDRFPDLEPIVRGGRKYWKLPRTSRARPLQLPRTLEALSERIVELEAQISETRSNAEAAQGVRDSVLGTSHVGMIVVDANSKVVWANESLGRFLCQDVSEMIGADMRKLIRDRVQHIFADPERFSRNVLATYEDNTYIENFECHVVGGPNRQERWLEHWSRPIPSGRYAGGRLDHYVDITARVRDDDEEEHPRPGRTVTAGGERHPPLDVLGGEGAGRPQPVLRGYLATLQEAASAAIDSADASPALLLRLAQVVQSMSQAITLSLDVIDKGQSKPEALGALAALETIQALVQGAADEKGVHVEILADPALPLIRGDRALVVSTLAGTVRNSIDALPRGSRIQLIAELLSDPARVRISIRDDGPGVPSVISKLETPFVPTTTGGLGLGIHLLRDAEGKPAGISQYYETATWPGDAGEI